MISVIQNDDKYEIRFRYDPNVIDLVKQVSGRRWDPDNKMWIIPKDKLGFLLNQFKGTVYESAVKVESDEHLNENETLDSTVEIPAINLDKIPFYVKEGSSPYPHQLDFMRYAIDRQQHGRRSGFILADEPGLGKTLEVMNLAIYNRKQYGFKHCLIICCINSSRCNWKRDIELHSNGEEVPYILGSRLKRNGEIRYDGSEAKYQDLVTGRMYGDSEDDLPYFIIVNIEALRYRVKKQHLITAQLISLINSGYINMIAIDEIHKNTSASSDQGKQLAEIHKRITSPVEWIPMTGTPITNKPTDVYLPLRLVGGHTFTSYFMWCRQFCVYGGYGDHEIIGYKNIPQLKDMLQRNMLRRLKKDVLKLPPKIQFTEYIELSPTQSKLYEKLLQDAVNSKDEIAQSLNPLSRLMKLRQVTGSPELIDEDIPLDAKYISKNAKLLRLLELLEEIHERGEKVVIFSNWVEPLRTLYRYIAKKYNVCTFTGTMSLDAREENKRRFQTDPNYTVLLGTIGAAGTTHTFTAATNVIFFDECWTPADKEQAEDRCYRIGTDSFVNIYTLIAMNTVDERVHDILYTKKGVSQYIVDNKLDIRNNPKLLDIILEDGSVKLRR